MLISIIQFRQVEVLSQVNCWFSLFEFTLLFFSFLIKKLYWQGEYEERASPSR